MSLDLQPITAEDGWTAGEDATFVFVALDADEQPQDLTGYALSCAFYARGALAGATAIMGPYTVGSGISIVTISTSSIAARMYARYGIDTSGWASTITVAKVAVPDTDSASIAPDTYDYELWRTDTPKTRIAYGPAVLLASKLR